MGVILSFAIVRIINDSASGVNNASTSKEKPADSGSSDCTEPQKGKGGPIPC